MFVFLPVFLVTKDFYCSGKGKVKSKVNDGNYVKIDRFSQKDHQVVVGVVLV